MYEPTVTTGAISQVRADCCHCNSGVSVASNDMPTWTFNLLPVCLEQFVLDTVETDLVSKVYE